MPFYDVTITVSSLDCKSEDEAIDLAFALIENPDSDESDYTIDVKEIR